jgi:hypothetical protein
MCLLIVLRSQQPAFPVLVASNRDERRDRKASPPGLWLGQRRRAITPRDRLAGGTWIGVNDRGLFAGLTNVTGAPIPKAAPSRGHLVPLALDQDGLDAAAAAVGALLAATPHGGCQLVLCDGQHTRVLRHVDGVTTVLDWADPLLVVSNEHAPGQLSLPQLAAAAAPNGTAQERLQRLRPLLLDRGGDGRHAVLKTGGDYGTVSSSLLAVAAEPGQLVWLYAAGPPDVTDYRNYGNLGRRLVDDGP